MDGLIDLLFFVSIIVSFFAVLADTERTGKARGQDD
jgi:hypothetical protein